jgi:hypothetical protein
VSHFDPDFWLEGFSSSLQMTLSLLRAVPRRNTRGLCSQGTANAAKAKELREENRPFGVWEEKNRR